MQALSQNKTAITLAILVMLGLFLYNSFFSEPITPSAPPAASVGADILKTSQEISKATLSRELFSQSSYMFLSDFSKPLEVQPVGRANPFAPLGQ